ncbi:hypothetical protein RRG08_012864 [Elysia crispata]|uniref:Uncharacterized protein n=1 Tax=Elysia crispata TaxID=231223 RepID=A0AAE0Y7E2_9GAST|nr:hypothetical protein RRG08_012864 [Elysia crispata]
MGNSQNILINTESYGLNEKAKKCDRITYPKTQRNPLWKLSCLQSPKPMESWRTSFICPIADQTIPFVRARTIPPYGSSIPCAPEHSPEDPSRIHNLWEIADQLGLSR